MEIFSDKKFELAKDFIYKYARPLEKALLVYEFENGSKDDVIQELKKFQNDDGGFGHALEPDIRSEVSSALASSVALQILIKINADEKEPIVKEVINYFITSFDPITKGWEKIPKAAELAPRAPWWNYQEPRKDWGNPNAEILGYFYKYHQLVPASLVTEITEFAISYFNSLQEYEFHEVLCFLRLAEHLPGHYFKQMEEKLHDSLIATVAADSQTWNEYTLQPVQAVPSPASRYYSIFKDVMNENLSFVINQQNSNGSWSPAWSWFGQYDDVWQIAKTEWEGQLTLTNLLLFRSYDLLPSLNRLS